MADEPQTPAKSAIDLGPQCPSCGEPWLRPTNLPGRYRCVYGEHSTIVRMSSTAIMKCNNCGDSMLQPV
jgi:ribosomal protein S27E